MSRMILVVLLIVGTLLLAVARGAAAQDCTIGVYSDPAGTVDGICLPSDGSFFVYVVMHVDDSVASVSYSLQLPYQVFVLGRIIGPTGIGSATNEPGGTTVALGECASGFDEVPVLVDTWVCVVPGYDIPYDQIVLGPHADVNPDYPQYATCDGIEKACEPGSPFYFGYPMIDCRGGVRNEPKDFTAIKALFGGG